MGLPRAIKFGLVAAAVASLALYAVPSAVGNARGPGVSAGQHGDACLIPPFDGVWRGRARAAEWIAGVYPRHDLPDGAVALTFDDGPMDEKTERILDLLEEYEMPATFFVVGRKIDDDGYALVQRMVAEGHVLANHSYDHDTRMFRVDRRDDPHAYIRAQYTLTQAMVDIALVADGEDDFLALRDELLGEHSPRIDRDDMADAAPDIEARRDAILIRRRGSTHSPYPMIYSRPPGGSPYYGDWSERTRDIYADVLIELRMLNMMWTHSTHDSDSDMSRERRRDESRLAREIEEAAEEGGILLIHDRIDYGGLREGLERIDDEDALRVTTLDAIIDDVFACDIGAVAMAMGTSSHVGPAPERPSVLGALARSVQRVENARRTITVASTDAARLRVALARESARAELAQAERDRLATRVAALEGVAPAPQVAVLADRPTPAPAFDFTTEAARADAQRHHDAPRHDDAVANIAPDGVRADTGARATDTAHTSAASTDPAITPPLLPAEPSTPPLLAAAPRVAPSPETGPTPCGAAPEGFVCVPGGWFERGVDEDEHACDQSGAPRDREPSTVPRGLVWVDTFYMAVTETTNAAYGACVERGQCAEAGARFSSFRRDALPITGVSWFDARNYCQRAGGHLPTEAEWELAARGPAGDVGPWGNGDATCDVAIIRDARGRKSCGIEREGSHGDDGTVVEPCSRGPLRYGICDMVGNAEEWVADWWSDDWDACGADCAGVSPLGPCDGAEDCDDHRYRVARGGSWYYEPEHATGYHRRRHTPDNDPFRHLGFRCALSPDEAAALTRVAQVTE